MPRRRRTAPAFATSWEVSGVRAAYPALPMLAQLLPDATAVVTVGSERAWFGMAGDHGEGAGALPALGAGEARLPFSPGTLSRLLLAARSDGEEAFCRELRVYRGTILLLRWLVPVAGPIHIAAEISERAVFRFASLAAGAYRLRPGPL